MRIKICGITNLEDARVAIEAGADAVGFIFYPKSPRYIAPKNVRTITEKLPPFVERVGVFVQQSAEEIDSICSQCHLSLAQIHWDMAESEFSKLKTKAIRVIRVQSQSDLQKYADEYRLVDAWVEGYGGEGKRIALEWLQQTQCNKIIAAGGLNPDNIKELDGLGLYGVDANSGVEKTHGIKDHAKVHAFVQRAKLLK